MEDSKPKFKPLFQAGRVKPEPKAPKRISRAADLRQAIFAALNALGGVTYLMEVGKNNPGLFVQLLLRVLPVKAELDIGETMQVAQIGANLTPREAMLHYMEALRHMQEQPVVVDQPPLIEYEDWQQPPARDTPKH